MNKLYFLAALVLSLPIFSKAQNNNPFSKQDTAANQVVSQFFKGLNNTDTTVIKPLLKADAVFVTVSENGLYETQAVPEFLKSLARLNTMKIEERPFAFTARYSGAFAEISMDYDFFLNGEKLHCGSNSFELLKQDGQWRISRIVDTRIKDCLPVNLKAQLAGLINNWHIAASKADEEAYFSFLTDSAVFIGTDSTERWLKDDFRKWAQPAFSNTVAWDFKATGRNIRLNEAENIAWFDEQLSTWMGTCQASGVLSLGPMGWQLEHYQLSVTVPNEKLKPFVDLIYDN